MNAANLTRKIPAGHVMLLYWVRMPNDTRDTASSTGSVIRPVQGAINAAREIDASGDMTLHDNHGRGYAAAGHGVTILWPSGHSRNVRA